MEIAKGFANAPERELLGAFYDVAVFGTGYAGYAAARAAEAAGKSVLLLDARCDLLWESGRARHPVSGPWTDAFRPFGRAATCLTGIAADWIDPGSAEWIANELLMESKVRRLYFAVPVAVDRAADGSIARVTVALRNGLASISAAQWIDATEEGAVGRLCDPSLTPAMPRKRVVRFFLQRLRWPCARPQPIRLGVKGAKMRLVASEWSCESILEVELAPSFTGSVTSLAVPVAEAFRATVGKRYDDAFFTHWSFDPYPFYPANLDEPPSPAPNLALASPAFRRCRAGNLVDRFTLGRRAAQALDSMPRCEEGLRRSRNAPAKPVPVETVEADVFVAGLGTGGTMAAIVAARRGASVLGAEPQSVAGGVATTGGIPAYYWGVSGGMQREVDQDVLALEELFARRKEWPSGYHPLARQVVGERLLDAAGAKTLYNATVVSVERKGGKLVSALLAVGGRIVRVQAKAWIDGTGEGMFCAWAGAPSTKGRSGDGFMQAFTQSWGAFGYFKDGLSAFISNLDCGFVDPDSSLDMTNARIRGAHYCVEHSTVRTSNAFDRTTGLVPTVGIRQGRLIATERPISLDDLVSRRRFPDAIGFTGGHYDNHSRDYFFESESAAFYVWCASSWGASTACEIPYRGLLPIGLSNVWLACRAAACDEESCNGFRMQRDIQRIGETAGIAAQIAVRDGLTSRNVPYAELREALAATGALDEPTDKNNLFGRAVTAFEGDPVLSGEATPDKIDAWMGHLADENPGPALWRLYRLSSDARPVARLRALLRSRSGATARNAAFVLGAWGDASAVPALRKMLAVRDVARGWNIAPRHLAAAWVLGLCGDRSCYAGLAALATDPAAPTLVRLTALWSCGTIVGREKRLAAADKKLLLQALAHTADIRDPERPWERPLLAERLRKALGLPPDPADSAALMGSPSLLARRAYERALFDR